VYSPECLESAFAFLLIAITMNGYSRELQIEQVIIQAVRCTLGLHEDQGSGGRLAHQNINQSFSFV